MSPDVIARLREHRLFVVYFAIVFCVLSIGTGAVYLLFDKPELGIDDARIFFVYGENIVEGRGIVFNSGGERVEGFTSPLWLLLVVAVHALFNRPDIYLLIFSLLILSAAISVLWYSEISKKLISWQSALFVLWIVGTPAYIVWMSLPLMDTTIWSAILIISAVITIRASSPVLMALCMIPLVLTRPEGIIWGLVLLSLFAIGIGVKKGAAPAWRAVRLPMSVFLFTIVLLIGARLAYFGYPLPNTYYAKVSPDAIYNPNTRNGIPNGIHCLE
jgi:arabinofuranosyltransferase